MLAALLTGVNRAFPFVEGKNHTLICCYLCFYSSNPVPFALNCYSLYQFKVHQSSCSFHAFPCTPQTTVSGDILPSAISHVHPKPCAALGDIPSFEEHLQSLFKVVHVGPLATAIQSLVLLYQVMESRQAVSGRYYQALYTKLLEPQLRHSKKQASLNSEDLGLKQ